MKRYFRTLPAASGFEAVRALWSFAAACAAAGSLLFFAFWLQVSGTIRASERVIQAGYLTEQARQFSSALISLEAQAAVVGKGSTDDEAVKRMNRTLDAMDGQWQQLEKTAGAFSYRRRAAAGQFRSEWMAVKAAIFELVQAAKVAPVSAEISDAVSARISVVHKRLGGLIAAGGGASAESAKTLARWQQTATLRFSGMIIGLLALFAAFAAHIQRRLLGPHYSAGVAGDRFPRSNPQAVKPPLESIDDQV